MTLYEIQAFVVSVDPEARHYDSAQRHGPYTVWKEGRTLGMTGDGQHMGGIRFQIHRFTKREGDRIAAAFITALEARDDIAYEYVNDFEPDTGYIHHIFDCEGI